MSTVVCRNVNRACSRLTTDSQHHIRLTAQLNVETAETDRISLLNWCNPWIMHLNLSRWWVLYLLHLLWMNSSALVSFFSAALGRKKKENSNLLTLGICRDDNVTSVWRGELASCVAFITSENTCCCLSSSLFLVPQISSSSSRSPKRRPPSAPLIRHFFFLFTQRRLSSTPSFSLYAPSSVCLISALYTLYTWFLYQSFYLYLFHVLLFHLLSLSLLLFCFCWCVSLSARPCHSCMRERTPGARRVEWSNFPGEPDRCVRLLETFKEFQFPRADCSMNYSLATFGSLAPHSWYSLVYIFLYYSSINYILHWNFECDRQGEISPELAGKWARRERLLFFFTVPPLICR